MFVWNLLAKTDKKDAKWIADLFKHNLVAKSFLIRQLHDLVRCRFKLTNFIFSEKNHHLLAIYFFKNHHLMLIRYALLLLFYYIDYTSLYFKLKPPKYILQNNKDNKNYPYYFYLLQ